MRRLRLVTWLLGISTGVTLGGCVRDIDNTPPPDLSKVVVAQFDPTNPIPVLQIIPAPTALAEKPDGTGLSVVAQPCELPSTKQCLQFVNGWPTTTPITYYFSGDLDQTSIKDGIKIYEKTAAAPGLAPVDYDAAVGPRPQPPAACAEGNNGSNPPQQYTPAQIAPGIAVVLTPKMPLKPGTQYIVTVESYKDGETVKGLKTTAGDRVYPSDLFALLNAPPESAPIASDGTINSALLRSNVQNLVIASLYPGKSYSDLTQEEKDRVNAAVLMRSKQGLIPLYGFFNAVITPLTGANGPTKRERLIFANAWNTAGAVTEIEFDPLRQKVPFPNVQLLTATTGPGLNDVRVAIPILPACPAGMSGPTCDTPSAIGVKTGLNTLEGFSTIAPISVTATSDLDPMSAMESVVMYELDASGTPTGSPVPIVVRTTTASAEAAATLAIVPARPLKQKTTYVIGIKKGLKDLRGKTATTAATFSLLKENMPLISPVSPTGTVNTRVVQKLQCSTVPLTGMLAGDTTVKGSAYALETQVKRPRWQVAFEALEKATPPISRNNVLMAFTYKTQDITGTVDLIRGRLLNAPPGSMDPAPYDLIRTASGTPRLQRTGVVITGTTAIYRTLGLAEQFCVPLCQMGALQGIPNNMCTDMAGRASPAVFDHPLCQEVQRLAAGSLRKMELFFMAGFKLTEGNPFAGAGTFTRDRIVPDAARPGVTGPRVIRIPIWVVTGTGTPSAAGAPINIFQHGLGRMKEDGFVIANVFANTKTAMDRQGWVTVLMDMPLHGARASDIINNTTGAPCLNVSPEAVRCDAMTKMCTGGCDGVQDPSGTGFLSANVFASRDNFRQAIVDHLTLIKTLQVESGPMGLLPELDGARIGYVGQSLGGIAGGNLAAYAPELQAAVINVGGGSLVRDVLLKTVPQISGPLFAGLAAAGICTPNVPGDFSKGCKDTPAFRQFLVLAQTAVDPGDPVANAIAVLDAHNMIPPLTPAKVLMQMTIPDPVVPNSASQALGRAYGFNPADNSMTSHFQTYDFTPSTMPSCHGFLLAPSCGASLVDAVCKTYGAQIQSATFVASGGTVIAGRVATGVPPFCP